MLQVNTVLRDLDAQTGRYENVASPRFDAEFDERILVDVIQPYFRHLPQVRDFVLHRGPGYAEVLAPALYKVKDSPTLVWMLIRSNIPTILGVEEDNYEDMVSDT
jgi:hypothetical protein